MAFGTSSSPRLAVVLLAVASLAVPAPRIVAQTNVLPGAVPRITQPVDESHRVALSGNVHPLAQPRYDLGAAPGATPTGKIELLLERSPAQQQALVQYLSDVQNPHSSLYHQWLTPAQYGAAFGVADTDLQTIETWLQGHGFQIEQVPQARNLIQFSGTYAQIQSAFHTAIHTFQVNDVRLDANVQDPQIPAALQPVVAGVGPLNNFHPASQARFGGTARFDTSSHSIKPDFTLFNTSGTPYLYVDPADAATIYDTPNATLNASYNGTTYDGTGVNIGIAGDSNFTMQDVTNYRVAFLNETSATANLPTIIVDGNDPGINGDEAEALLDNEVAGGLAPKAKLYFYTSADSDLAGGLENAIFRALDDNTVSILNISFGECEADLGTDGNQLFLEAATQAAAQGISVTVSSGDNGSAGCDNQDAETSAQYGLGVNGIASTPYTIAVGGTDFDALAGNFTQYVSDSSGGNPSSGAAPYYETALSYIPERPWNDSTSSNNALSGNVPLGESGATNIIAGSGGASGCVRSTTAPDGTITCLGGYAKPAFQGSLTPTDSARDVPDVAFLAANGLYGAVWLVCADNNCEETDGQFTGGSTFSGYGGTSAAAPAFAGMLALVEQKTGSRLGQADSVLYQLASSSYAADFHDVTEGNNSVVCAAGSPNCGSNGFLTGYNAGTGYDQASGLGSVDAAHMLRDWGTATLGSTSTTLTINNSTAPLSVTHGTSLTFNAGVTPSTATGAVAIIDTANEVSGGPQNNGQIAIPLTAGSGSVVYNGLPGGTYTVSARYSGDATDASSTSSPAIQVTIAPEASTTGLTVNAYSAVSPNPTIANLASVPYGSYIFADSQIYGKAEGANTQGIATGTVALTDLGTTVASALPISAGDQASFSSPATAYPAFAVGPHSLVAAYSGDPSFNASSSAAVNFTVVKDPTVVAVSASNSSIDSPSSTKITVAVDTTSEGAFPTGTVVLSANGNTLATMTGFQAGGGPNGAVASYATAVVQGSALASGANTITATYSGDGNYVASTGTTTVNVAEAGFRLTGSGAVSVAAGSSSSAQIAVSPSNGFTGVINLSSVVTSAPSGASAPATCSIPGTVNINGTGSTSATMTVSTSANTSAGAYVVTVSGVDATTGKITASAAIKVTVTGTSAAAGFSLSNAGAITVNPGATTGNTATISVTPSGGFTGQVNLSCGVTTSVANPTDLPTCSIPASVTVSGATAPTATLTVATTGGTTALSEPLKLGLPGGAVLAAALLFGLPLRRRRLAAFFLLAFLMIVSAGVMGCGGSGSTSGGGGTQGGTTAGAYTVTVTGVDAATGKITETTAVTVTVN